MDPESQEGALKGRSNHACQNCRVLKARCLPSGTPGICRKCEKSGKQCIFNDKPTRPRKQYASRTAKIETKLDILMTQLNERSVFRPDAQEEVGSLQSFESPEGIAISKTTTLEPTPEIVPQFEAVSEVFADGPIHNFDFDDYFDIPSDDYQNFIAILDRGFLTKEKAVYLFNRFRNMTQHFPFIVIPPSVSFDMMAHKRPFLLLTAITAACAGDQSLQHALGEEVRSVISQKVVFDGEKNLDILEGLLVHLAWYQYHYVPGRQQFAQFLQITLSLMTDLGLDKTPREAYIERRGLDISHYYEDTSMSSTSEFYSREARRCYLGCYFLANVIRFGYWIPTPLKHAEYMTKCAESLRNEAEYPTDALMPWLLRFAYLSEQVDATYRLTFQESHTQTIASVALVQMHAQTFAAQLEAWKASVPFNYEGNYGTHSTQLSIRIHEMGYVSRQKTFSPSFPIPSPDAFRCLFTCINAAKSHFAAFFTIPLSHYSTLPLSEWMGLISAVFTLYRLSTLTIVPGWNTKVARDLIKLDRLLSELCYRLQGAATNRNAKTGGTSRNVNQGDTLYNQFRIMADDVRSTYLRLKEGEDSGEMAPHNLVKYAATGGGGVKKLARSMCPFFRGAALPPPSTAYQHEQLDVAGGGGAGGLKGDHIMHSVGGNHHEQEAVMDAAMYNWTTTAATMTGSTASSGSVSGYSYSS